MNIIFKFLISLAISLFLLNNNVFAKNFEEKQVKSTKKVQKYNYKYKNKARSKNHKLKRKAASKRYQNNQNKNNRQNIISKEQEVTINANAKLKRRIALYKKNCINKKFHKRYPNPALNKCIKEKEIIKKLQQGLRNNKNSINNSQIDEIDKKKLIKRKLKNNNQLNNNSYKNIDSKKKRHLNSSAKNRINNIKGQQNQRKKPSNSKIIKNKQRDSKEIIKK